MYYATLKRLETKAPKTRISEKDLFHVVCETSDNISVVPRAGRNLKNIKKKKITKNISEGVGGGSVVRFEPAL